MRLRTANNRRRRVLARKALLAWGERQRREWLAQTSAILSRHCGFGVTLSLPD